MDTKLNQIATLWSVVRQAHADPGEPGRAAKQALLERYSGAVHRYLLGAVRNADVAEELAQEFACRFLHGDLKGADRERGRFRDFVKGVLFHLVADYHNKAKRQPNQLASEDFEPGADCALAAERDEAFRRSWRDDLLARAWDALQRVETENHQPFYTVLRFRAANPGLPSSQMAEKLSELMGKPLTAPGVRKTLERARERFGDLLLDEVSQAIDNPSQEAVEEELADLGLLEYCRPALERRRT